MELQEKDPQESKGLGTWQAFVGVITSPGATFAKLAEAPMVWKPSLILALLGVLATAPFFNKYIEFSKLLIERTQSMANLPAGTDVSQIAAMGGIIAAVSQLIGVIASFILFPIIIAALLKLLNMVMGEEAKFKQLWSVAAFSQVPAFFGLLLGNLLLLTASGDNLITTATLKTSLANLVSIHSVPPFLFALLAGINVFGLWGIALTSIGTAKVFRTKVSKVALVLLGVWVAYILITALTGQGKILDLLS